MKKLYDTLTTISLCNIILIVCCVVMMLVMVLTQTGYYLTIDVWHGSVLLVLAEIVIEIVLAFIKPNEEIDEKDRA